MYNDICHQFDPYRGDLLYGFAADRGELWNHVWAFPPGCPLRMFFDQGYTLIFITVDHYNDSLFGDQALFQADQDPIKKKADAVTHPWVKEFWRQMSTHRFSPLEAFNAPPEKRTREGWNDLANDRYYLAIRRGCKFGFEYILNNVLCPDAKIHFLMDRFDRNVGERMVQAVQKQAPNARGRTAVSITYSEIRYVYRNWDRLRGRVLFYYNFMSEEAPWEDEVRVALWNDGKGPIVESYKELWARYGSNRKDKLLAMIVKGKVAFSANYNSHRADVDRLVKEAEANVLEPDTQCTKYEQALTLLQPDRKRWRELRT